MNEVPKSEGGFDAFRRAYSAASSEAIQWVRPYPGLRSFEPNDSEIFFGRQVHIDRLLAKLESQSVIAVIGGSGSGKSSIVRAGMIPALTSTYKLEGRLGRWYVAHFKPGQSPADALTSALWEQLCCEMFLSRPKGLVALATVLGVGGEFRDHLVRAPSATDENMASLRKIFDQKLRPDNRLSPRAISWFASDALEWLDRELNPTLRSGSPSLMLLIDQFEELFDSEVDPEQREDLLAALKRVFEGSEGLYIVITMRSEQLHRCAEFAGLPEIINGSMYLIDLVDEPALREAIVRPAKRVFERWQIPYDEHANAPFAPGLVEWLLGESTKLRASLRHKPDQLPLMQHALRLIWGNALDRWSNMPPACAENLAITQQDLPEWNEGSGVGFMRGCLNVAANETFQDATHHGVEGQNSSIATRRRLRALFIALARLDDRGNWARHLVGRDKVREAMRDQPFGSSTSEAASFDGSSFERALKAFINRVYIMMRHTGLAPVAYEVSHEALIRHWALYQRWLDEASDVNRSLQRVAENLLPTETSEVPERWPDIEPYRASSLPDVWKWCRAVKERYAAGIVSEYDRKCLAQAFGGDADFGSQWLVDSLVGFLRDRDKRMGQGVKPLQYYKHGAGRLLVAIANAYRLVPPVWRTVERPRKNLIARLFDLNLRPENRSVFLGSSAILAVLLGGTILFLNVYYSNIASSAQGKFLLAQALLSDTRGRTAEQAAYDTKQALKRLNSVPESIAEPLFRATLSRIDDATRTLLGKPAVIDSPLLDSSDREHLRLAQCVATGPDFRNSANQSSLLVKSKQGYRGLGWVVKEGANSWEPVFYRDGQSATSAVSAVPDSRSERLAASFPTDRASTNRAIYCLSSNGSFVFSWEPGKPPRIVALVWYPVGGGSEQAVVKPLDLPIASPSSFEWLVNSFDNFYGAIGTNGSFNINEFTTDSTTMFLLGGTNYEPKIGFEVMRGVLFARPSEVESLHLQEMRCLKGKEEGQCQVNQRYRGRDVVIRIYSDSCVGEPKVCRNDVRVTDLEQNGRDDPATPWLVIDDLPSVQIVEAGIVRDRELWLIDEIGQSWVLDIGIPGLAGWADTIQRANRNKVPNPISVACQQLQCESW